MTKPHKATPEQWAQIEQLASSCIYDLAILELRDRLAALEAAANSSATLTGSNHPEKPDSSPAPASGLVEIVADAIVDSAAAYGTADEPAQAAVLAVAEWFDAIGYGATASILRQELQRHG